MYRVLILWAPDTTENRRIVDSVSRAFEELKAPAIVKRAAEGSIADVTASDIVLFGVEKGGASELPAEYADWLRVLKGISLAGRTAGFFSMGAERATARLRKVLKDTDISQSEDDPLFGDSRQAVDLPAWAGRLIGAHRELKNGRA